MAAARGVDTVSKDLGIIYPREETLVRTTMVWRQFRGPTIGLILELTFAEAATTPALMLSRRRGASPHTAGLAG